MSVTSKASTIWNGSLFEGSGDVTFDSSHLGTFPINWKARSEGSESTTTPEELIAAAHASCYSMALSHGLTGNGTPPGLTRDAPAPEVSARSAAPLPERQPAGAPALAGRGL